MRVYNAKVVSALAVIPILAILSGVQPYLLKMIIDRQGINEALDPLIIIAVLGVVIFGGFLTEVWLSFRVEFIAQGLVSDIRKKLFSHLQSLTIDFFERNQVGKLLTRLTNDVEALAEMFSAGLVGAASDTCSILGLVCFMAILDWRLTLVQLSLIPLFVICIAVFGAIYRASNAESRRQLAQLNSLLQEGLSGLSVIKLFCRERFCARRFAGVNSLYNRANNRLILADSSFSAVIELMGIVGIMLVLLAGALMPSEVSPGKLVAFIGYSQLFFAPIRSLSEKFATFQAGFTAIERINELLKEKPTIAAVASTHVNDPSRQAGSPFVSTELSCEGVSFSYSLDAGTFVLENISFTLGDGQSLGIVGRTGSGKSTLIKLLCRFYDPTAGVLRIGGIDLRSIEPSELRKHVLMVPQRSFIFGGSIRDNLTLDKRLSDDELNRLVEDTGLAEMLESQRFTLQTNLRERGAELSAGQKQLISLTRAMVQNPQLLILDEATASLDKYTESLVNLATRRLIRGGKTVLFVAHRLNLVAECSRILVLKDGKIDAFGTHSELMQQDGYYARLTDLSRMV